MLSARLLNNLNLTAPLIQTILNSSSLNYSNNSKYSFKCWTPSWKLVLVLVQIIFIIYYPISNMRSYKLLKCEARGAGAVTCDKEY